MRPRLFLDLGMRQQALVLATETSLFPLAQSVPKRPRFPSPIRMRFLPLLLAFLTLGCFSAPVLADVAEAAGASVVRIRAYHANGRVSFGSAVVIGTGKLVTNAHVTHGARRIEVVENDRTTSATVTAHDAVRDFCFLDAPLVTAPAARLSRGAQAGRKCMRSGFL